MFELEKLLIEGRITEVVFEDIEYKTFYTLSQPRYTQRQCCQKPFWEKVQKVCQKGAILNKKSAKTLKPAIKKTKK